MLRADCDSSFHVFCRAGDKYLDAAGLANSVQELVDRLPYGGTVKTIKPVREIVLDGEYDAEGNKSNDAEGYAFALKIIERNTDEYRGVVSEESDEP